MDLKNEKVSELIKDFTKFDIQLASRLRVIETKSNPTVKAEVFMAESSSLCQVFSDLVKIIKVIELTRVSKKQAKYVVEIQFVPNDETTYCLNIKRIE